MAGVYLVWILVVLILFGRLDFRPFAKKLRLALVLTHLFILLLFHFPNFLEPELQHTLVIFVELVHPLLFDVLVLQVEVFDAGVVHLVYLLDGAVEAGRALGDQH